MMDIGIKAQLESLAEQALEDQLTQGFTFVRLQVREKAYHGMAPVDWAVVYDDESELHGTIYLCEGFVYFIAIRTLYVPRDKRGKNFSLDVRFGLGLLDPALTLTRRAIFNFDQNPFRGSAA